MPLRTIGARTIKNPKSRGGEIKPSTRHEACLKDNTKMKAYEGRRHRLTQHPIPWM